MIPWLGPKDPFPPVSRALQHPNGLLAAGGDLSVQRLLSAYSRGIFPWYSDQEPILWWSPDPRMVLVPSELTISRSLRKTLRNTCYEVRADSAFEAVMRACAAPREGQAGTWITEEMIEAYCELHAAGFAHSMETWMDGRLAGGLYGVSLGRMFFGESMFARVSNASKIALVHLAGRLREQAYGMIDCQMTTPHLASLGAREIPRELFLARVRELVHSPDALPGPWQYRVRNEGAA
ncbi:MAG: leucyl/phenylalanyl-tRNA--protein transferase [Betaproteobacteria bacterium]|nr:leucyl/phenylalanyl-tRNA--protein transferase [Betaproteobacteria bacterium]